MFPLTHELFRVVQSLRHPIHRSLLLGMIGSWPEVTLCSASIGWLGPNEVAHALSKHVHHPSEDQEYVEILAATDLIQPYGIGWRSKVDREVLVELLALPLDILNAIRTVGQLHIVLRVAFYHLGQNALKIDEQWRLPVTVPGLKVELLALTNSDFVRAGIFITEDLKILAGHQTAVEQLAQAMGGCLTAWSI